MTRAAAAAAAAAGVLLACASGGARPGAGSAEPALRIWVPTVVHWGPEGRELRFALENGTERTLKLGEPDASGARVAIFSPAEDARACGIEPSEGVLEGPVVELPPGDHLPVRVDLGAACEGLPPGEYRYELSYRAVRPSGGTTVLPTRYGTLVVVAPGRAAARGGRTPGRPPAPRSP